MKALTLTQPYATAVALGIKRVETRSWRTNYRGELAIHAAIGFPRWARDFRMTELALGRGAARIPRGAVVAIVQLVDCRRVEEVAIEISQDDPQRWGIEHLYGDYSPGRWAWVLADVEPLAEPVCVKGALGLWEWKR